MIINSQESCNVNYGLDRRFNAHYDLINAGDGLGAATYETETETETLFSDSVIHEA